MVLEVVAPRARGSYEGEAGSLPTAAARSGPAQAEMGSCLTLMAPLDHGSISFHSSSLCCRVLCLSAEKPCIAEKHLTEIKNIMNVIFHMTEVT